MWCQVIGISVACCSGVGGPKGCGCDEDLSERDAAGGDTAKCAKLSARRWTWSMGGLPLLGGAGGGHGDDGRVASGVDCGVAADDDEDDDLKLRSRLTCCWKFALGRAPPGAGSP